MTGFLNDLRQSWRSLRRTPSFTIAAVLTLGLGIGVTGAVYSVGNGLLWRPIDAPGADRITVLYVSRESGQDHDELSWPDYLDLKSSGAKVFEDMIALMAEPISVGHAGQSERLYGELVSDNYFTFLGTTPSTGRTFLPADAAPDATPAVVLSDGFWRSRFQANPAVVGQTVKLNGQQFSVIGVAPASFRSPFYIGFSPAFWMPMSAYPLLRHGNDRALAARGAVDVRILGRLRPGVSLAEGQAASRTLVARIAQQYPAAQQDFTGELFAERDARPEPEMAQQMQLAFQLFLVIAGGVLLVACANVAALLLARAIARRREIAVRLALGAGRGRLIRQLLTESLLLAVAGGALGLIISSWMSLGMTRLLSFSTDIPFTFDLSADQRVIGFTSAVTLVTVFLFGLLPALQASSPKLQGTIKGDDGRGRSPRLFALLVSGQVALSCLLLIGAGLVVRTLGVMRNVHPGFATEQRLLLSITPGLQGYDSTRGNAVYRQVLREVGAIPGVVSVTLADNPPLDFTSNSSHIMADGVDLREPGGLALGLTTVGADYFATMETRLVDGRDFTAGDTVGAPRVTIVSQALAQRVWPGQSAVGRLFRFAGDEGESYQVIGVAADARYRQLSETPQPHAYFPVTQEYAGSVSLIIRTTVDPLSLAEPVRAAIVRTDPDLPIAAVRTYAELLAGRALLFPSIAARITATMGALALLLSLIGLYGIVAYRVAQRRRELGIRLALGATNGSVVGMMLRHGVRLAGWGIVAGVAGALLVTRVARALLFGVSPTDPVVLFTVIALLVSVTLFASWIPARRASRVDLIGVLRGE